MLTEKRTEIKTVLEAGAGKPTGFKAFEYVGETLSPPCAAIVPAEPYMRGPSRADDTPFGRARLSIDVLLISSREDAAKAAKLQDELIEFAWHELRAVDGIRVTGVSRPGVITVSGAKYIGSVLSIEQLTEEP